MGDYYPRTGVVRAIFPEDFEESISTTPDTINVD
jgi:hypothetical protein